MLVVVDMGNTNITMGFLDRNLSFNNKITKNFR